MQVAFGAVFGDDVAVIDAEVNIMAEDYVGVLKLAKDRNLALEQSVGYFALDILDDDLFYCYDLIGEHVGSFVDFAETSLSYFLG